uniref:Reverse transcriptase domain-containing protein n=1 Tax=Tanacetum cinerariifolium TaxID=118510 RepID=A0A6L2L7F7_TANCI|nr:hypothetical protein [Tanacetum cinerariifolium]
MKGEDEALNSFTKKAQQAQFQAYLGHILSLLAARDQDDDDDEEESSEDEEDGETDVEADEEEEEEEHPAPANSVVVALTAADHAPSTKETEPFKTDDPPHIIHHCCYGCDDPLEDIFCHQCTCESCGKGAHYGYNCPPKVLIIPNPEPCNNQTIDELPQTLLSFHPTCYSGNESPFTCDSTPDVVDDSPNVFNPPLQPPKYSYEFCGNDAYYGHDCPPQVSFTYSSIISSSSKIDSLLDKFAGELTLLNSIPLGINETDCDPEEETRLIKKLLYDNSSPRPPKEFISENSDTAIKSFSPFPIPVEDSDSFMEEIDLSFILDDPMPPGIKEDDYDSERDILILEELLSNNSLSLLENESFHFDIPSSSRLKAKS